jgi:hypothetical protein
MQLIIEQNRVFTSISQSPQPPPSTLPLALKDVARTQPAQTEPEHVTWMKTDHISFIDDETAAKFEGRINNCTMALPRFSLTAATTTTPITTPPHYTNYHPQQQQHHQQQQLLRLPTIF